MVLVSELLTSIRDMVDEPTAAQWTDDMFGRWINEGARDLARSTRHLKGSKTVAVTGGDSEYTLTADVVAVEHVYWTATGDDRRIPLIPKHWEGMDQVWGSWQNRESSNPVYFTVVGMSPAAMIKLYPTPADGGSLFLMVSQLWTPIAIPVVPAATADVPAIWYDAIVDYVEYKGLRRDRDPRFTEALDMYTQKRDALMNNPDFLAVNREVVPTPSGQYVDAWLVEMDPYGY